MKNICWLISCWNLHSTKICTFFNCRNIFPYKVIIYSLFHPSHILRFFYRHFARVNPFFCAEKKNCIWTLHVKFCKNISRNIENPKAPPFNINIFLIHCDYGFKLSVKIQGSSDAARQYLTALLPKFNRFSEYYSQNILVNPVDNITL